MLILMSTSNFTDSSTSTHVLMLSDKEGSLAPSNNVLLATTTSMSSCSQTLNKSNNWVSLKSPLIPQKLVKESM